ncbi:MAG: hypothetical protein KDA41_02290 [Planctomycetales bacterium]|nr:hypothetical protein [Planctomycetales bacterium]
MMLHHQITARRFVWLALLLSVAAGCGKSGPPVYRVTGEVTWDGAPLGEGDILFESGDALPAYGKIRDGAFEFESTAGAKRVVIQATKEADTVDPAMGARPRISFIPPRYNANTTLSAEVQESGDNHFRFELTRQD